MGTTEKTDNELVSIAISGSRTAFDELVLRHEKSVFAAAYGVLHSREEALDCAQEAFLSAYTKLSSFSGQSFKSWVSRIAYNRAVDLIRSNREVAGLFERTKRAPSPEAIFEKREKKREVAAAISQLSKESADTVREYYFEGKSYTEIAKKDGISEKTVESRLYRAKKTLKELMKGGRTL